MSPHLNWSKDKRSLCERVLKEWPFMLWRQLLAEATGSRTECHMSFPLALQDKGKSSIIRVLTGNLTVLRRSVMWFHKINYDPIKFGLRQEMLIRQMICVIWPQPHSHSHSSYKIPHVAQKLCRNLTTPDKYEACVLKVENGFSVTSFTIYIKLS